jgi:hypothetical protein
MLKLLGDANRSIVTGERPVNQATIRRPRWIARQRQLWLGMVLVKQTVRSARAMERILAEFEEEGWPELITIPCPPCPAGGDSGGCGLPSKTSTAAWTRRFSRTRSAAQSSSGSPIARK